MRSIDFVCQLLRLQDPVVLKYILSTSVHKAHYNYNRRDDYFNNGDGQFNRSVYDQYTYCFSTDTQNRCIGGKDAEICAKKPVSPDETNSTLLWIKSRLVQKVEKCLY